MLSFLGRFEDYFSNRVQQLTFTFPETAVTSTGAPFWSAPKRFPRHIQFSASDPTCAAFVTAAAVLRAETLGVPLPDWARDVQKVAEVASNVMVPEFVPKQVCFCICICAGISLCTPSLVGTPSLWFRPLCLSAKVSLPSAAPCVISFRWWAPQNLRSPSLLVRVPQLQGAESRSSPWCTGVLLTTRRVVGALEGAGAL